MLIERFAYFSLFRGFSFILFQAREVYLNISTLNAEMHSCYIRHLFYLERKVERITRHHDEMLVQNIRPRLNLVGRDHYIFRYAKPHSPKHAVLGTASCSLILSPFSVERDL